MAVIHVGATDASISRFHKVSIHQNISANTSVTVHAFQGEEGTLNETANWTSPFEGESVGEKFSKTGGLIQELTGGTSKTKLLSAQVWDGNQPFAFDLSLRFFAIQGNADKEVMQPLKWLSKFMAPEMNEDFPIEFNNDNDLSPDLGRAPSDVSLNIAGKIIYRNCKIETKSMNVFGKRDANGNFGRAEVNLSIHSSSTINRSEIDSIFL